MRLKWFAIWLVVNVLLLVVPPIATFYKWQSNLAHSHPPIPRFNADGGDALGIPIGIVLIQTFCGLFLLNITGLCGLWIYKNRRRK